jgi:hypothetical protein
MERTEQPERQVHDRGQRRRRESNTQEQRPPPLRIRELPVYHGRDI